MTLIELMVGVLLFALLATGALSMMSGQQKTSVAQQRSDSVLDNARATLNAMAYQLRAMMADSSVVALRNGTIRISSGTPTGPTSCGSGDAPMIEVTSGGAGAPDSLRVVVPDGAVWGALTAAVDQAAVLAPVRTTGGDAAIAVGEWGLLTDFTQVVLFPVSSKAGTAPDFQLGKVASTDAFSIPQGGFFLRARWLEYSVSTTAFGPNTPALILTTLPPAGTAGVTEPVATGIEDLQVALFLDMDNNGVPAPESAGADGDEWVFNVAGETVRGTCLTPSDCDCALKTRLRAIRISVVARASSEDQGAMPVRPQLEDRNAGTADGIYRVVLSTVVALRN